MEKNKKRSIYNALVVDDEPWNLEILHALLSAQNYVVTSAENGREAWELLEKSPDAYDVVILDRKMPEMDGMAVLQKMKAHPRLADIPVVFQTAQSSRKEILEGLQAGAYYYLTKPYQEDQMLAVVKTAAEDFTRQKKLLKETQQTSSTLALMEHGIFKFKTLEEGQDLAKFLANSSPDSTRLVVGLLELMINAVEHGNLGISYQEKSLLIQEKGWKREVERRMNLPEYREKQVIVEFEHAKTELRFLIRDQGKGFDWQNYLEFDPERAFDSHGRGVAMARQMSFDKLEYHGPGNEVLAIKYTKRQH
ncbi:MAG: response regulator [SAR324 cluster bacterium]|nr:response regulator [SAR324 cluster bacterium]